jgi:hypothetical protein
MKCLSLGIVLALVISGQSTAGTPAFDKCVAVFDGAMSRIAQEQNALADTTESLRGNPKAKCELARTTGVPLFEKHLKVVDCHRELTL